MGETYTDEDLAAMLARARRGHVDAVSVALLENHIAARARIAELEKWHKEQGDVLDKEIGYAKAARERCHDLGNEVSVLGVQLAQMRAERDELRESNQRKAEAIGVYAKANNEQAEMVRSLQSGRDDLRRELAALRDMLAFTVAERDDAREAARMADRDHDELAARYNRINDAIPADIWPCESTVDAVEIVVRGYLNLRAAIGPIEAERDELRAKLDCVRIMRDSLADEVHALRAAIGSAEVERDALRAKLVDMDRLISVLRDEVLAHARAAREANAAAAPESAPAPSWGDADDYSPGIMDQHYSVPPPDDDKPESAPAEKAYAPEDPAPAPPPEPGEKDDGLTMYQRLCGVKPEPKPAGEAEEGAPKCVPSTKERAGYYTRLDGSRVMVPPIPPYYWVHKSEFRSEADLRLDRIEDALVRLLALIGGEDIVKRLETLERRVAQIGTGGRR